MLETGVGLAIGIPAALFGVRSIKSVQSQLYEVAGRDAGVIAGAVCTLAVAAYYCRDHSGAACGFD
jgi:macrolide transport system ATP-binding/permease protein